MSGADSIDLGAYRAPLFFVGAGMSAESGMPTYRGRGGIWSQYDYEDFACQRAFDRDPEKVLAFHRLRRERALACEPHAGHGALATLQSSHPAARVVTQNIDGLLQRAGVAVDAELHGSLWRLRCPRHGIRTDDASAAYTRLQCERCGSWLRPDITWFEDPINEAAFGRAAALVAASDLFVSIGTSAVVYPAAAFIPLARRGGARMVEINPETTDASTLFDVHWREPASSALSARFGPSTA